MATNYDLGASYPTAASFTTAQIRTVTRTWEYHRTPGSGGANFGDDHDASPGDVVVEIEYNDISDTGAGAFDYHVHTVQTGVILVPFGFHAGARLEPGSAFGGAGATFKGDVTMKVVSLTDWLPVVLSGVHP